MDADVIVVGAGLAGLVATHELTNFGRDWRRVREQLGVPEVTTHSFRKSVATLIDDRGFSARIGADQLGHARPSMTQDVYMSRGKIHMQVAEALDDAINGA